MQAPGKLKLLVAAAGIALSAALGFSSVSRADIVAIYGPFNIGDTGFGGCSTTACSAIGTGASAGGALPAAGAFTHEILFNVSTAADTIASSQVLNNTFINTAAMTMKLFEWTGGGTTLGSDPTGTELAAATKSFSGPGNIQTNFGLQFAGLDPTKLYFLQLDGGIVTNSSASYTHQISIVAPVPLPPALFLLAAALCGLIGYARIRRNNATV